jgi:hypothetical protein
MTPFHSYATEFWVAHLPEPRPTLHMNSKELSPTIQNELESDSYHSFLHTAIHFQSGRMSLLSFIEGLYMLKKTGKDRANLANDLEKWARKAHAQPSSIYSGDTSASQVYSGLAYLADYLRKLEADWAGTLSTTPELIWDDVLLHTPCHLVPATSNDAAHTLAPTMDERFKKVLSSKSLFKVFEISNDRHILAVVSIWPSR